MKKIFLICALGFFLCSLNEAFAYTPSTTFVTYAEKLSGQLNRLVSQMEPEKRKVFLDNINKRLVGLQNSMIGRVDTKSLDRNYLLEYLRRNIDGVGSFVQNDVIYDDLASIIWTHAPRGFDVLYSPYETKTLESNNLDQKYATLLNGGYFNRLEDAKYHAGMLAINGERYTPGVFDDRQITHFTCVDTEGRVDFIVNSAFREGFIDTCSILFQSGPMIYARRGDVIDEDYMTGTYLGRDHKRTAMVVFENNGIQDLWFLTINEEVSLKEVGNIVLRESRFIGEYDDISIFNLDGGSSVAHVNPLYPQLNIGRTKALPAVIGVK